MQLFTLIMSLVLSNAALADTKIQCEATVNGRKIEYREKSYRPCLGACINAKTEKTLTLTRMLEEHFGQGDLYDVMIVKDPKTEITPVPGSATVTRIAQTVDLVSETAFPEENVRTEHLYFQKNERVTIEIDSPFVGDKVTLSCDQVKQANLQKDL